MDYDEARKHACRKHKVMPCPTAEWIAGRTVVTTTPDGRLIYARVYALEEAAQAYVTLDRQRFDETVAVYVNKQLKLPAQFTEEGKMRCTVWTSGAVPTHDAWGNEVK